MSMLNRRTQPLDPNLLQGLTGAPQASPGQTLNPRATTPLSQALAPLSPEIQSDNLAPASAPKRPDIPAQMPGITLSTPATCARLSETEAELLLDVSAKLADARSQNPAQFQIVMSALQQLSADSKGQVDFSSLNPSQQQALSAMGMTPQNTCVIFQQLYQMLLPASQHTTSDAFKQVQAQVTGFISNLDLRERTVSQIQQQARDLTAVQGVVSTLSASSITSLLADKTAIVYDTNISTINSQNFDIVSPMDFTLGHMVVLSQKSPEGLQQVESLIQKVKQEQSLDASEQKILSRYGLNLNNENKLQTLDGHALDFQAVTQLENVIFSMKDPSPGYSKVLQASAAVIAESGKLEQLAALAEKQSRTVQQTTQVVVAGTQTVEQLRQDTNHIDAQLKFAHYKAENLADAMDAATGLFKSLNIDPQVLKQWNIQIVQGPQALQFFIENKEVSRLELLQHLGKLLQAQRSEISGMATQLAAKKTETLTANAQLNVTTQQLQVQTTELKETQVKIVEQTEVLKGLQLVYQETVKAEMPNLKPAEKAVVEEQMTPMLEHKVEQAVKKSEAVQVLMQATITQAETVIVRSQAVQQAVQDDAKIWDERLEKTYDLLPALDKKIEKAEAEVQQITQSIAPRSEAGFGESKLPETTGLAPVPKAIIQEDDPEELDARLLRIEQKRNQERNETSFMEYNQDQREFAGQLRQQKDVRERAKKDSEQLKAEVQDLIKPE